MSVQSHAAMVYTRLHQVSNEMIAIILAQMGEAAHAKLKPAILELQLPMSRAYAQLSEATVKK